MQYINFYQYPPPHKVRITEKDKLLSKLSLDSTLNSSIENYFTLFISIPYCLTMCNSCGFFKTLLPKSNKEELLNTYLERLILQIERFGDTRRFSTIECGAIYIGGGTASLLSPLQLEQLIGTIKESFNLSDNVEITLEGNPKDFASDNYLENVKELLINRISIGVQSTNDNILRILNSPHNSKEGINSIEKATKIGFNTINVDLMYGIPTQSFSDYFDTLNTILDLSPESITIYRYIIFPKSPMEVMINSKKADKPPTQEELGMWYFWTRQQMQKYGYIESRIGNFVKPPHEQKYAELAYLKNSESIGIGAGVYSFINGYLFKSSSNVKEFCTSVDNGLFVIDDFQSVQSTKKILMERFLMHHLYVGKINIDRFEEIFNTRPIDNFPIVFRKLERSNLIKIDNKNIELTDLGRNYIYDIVHEFWSEV